MPTCAASRLDVTDDASVAAAYAAVAAAGTGLDVLVNNAGIAVPARDPRHHARATSCPPSASTCSGRSG